MSESGTGDEIKYLSSSRKLGKESYSHRLQLLRVRFSGLGEMQPLAFLIGTQSDNDAGVLLVRKIA